jgi:hypothetical protein
MRGPAFSALFTCACGLLLPHASGAAPTTAQQLALQGVARDAADALIPAGDIAVRIYADSLGGAPLYDSGVEFSGAITQGIFDIVVGQATPMLLDQEGTYFLELDAAGVEVVGDAAGVRWRFLPGGGSRARPDLEARLDALEAAVGPVPASAGAPLRGGAQAASRAGEVGPDGVVGAGVHGMLGLGLVSGDGAAYGTTGNLLVQPVGVHANAGVTAELGPIYLFAPKPSPVIRSVRDVPGDQGRAVRVRWRRDLRERAFNASDPEPFITSYTLYRRVDPGQAGAARARVPGAAALDRDAIVPGAAALDRDAIVPGAAALDRDAIAPGAALTQMDAALALPPGDWDVLTTIPATLDTAYQTVVATLCDSTDVGICWSVFAVRAITDRTGTFHDSATDSGYSVDNLAPNVPAGLLLQAVSGGVALTWQPSMAPDFRYFRVYRSMDPDFVPDPGTLVHATVETAWTDPTTGAFTYKLTAVDFNGNESAPAVAAMTTGVDARSPTALEFASMAPNPFRRSLGLVIEIPEACGAIDLTVFDVAGRRVRTLASGTLPAGRHSFTWDGRTQEGGRAPAGIYVARLMGAGREFTRRATLLP